MNKTNTHIANTMVTAIKAFCDAGHKLKSITIDVDMMYVSFGGKARIVFVIAPHVGKTERDQRELQELMRYAFPNTIVVRNTYAMEGG